MSSAEYLKRFVKDGLTDRQQDILWKPVITLYRIDCPQRHVCKEEEEEEGPSDQLICKQEMNSSMDQEDPEPPQVKEEQEEVYISQDGGHLILKQEADTFKLTPTCEESDHSEGQTLYMKPEPPHVKDEYEEVYISQDGGRLILKQESDTFKLTLTCEESDHSEGQTLYMKPDEGEAQKESVVNMPVIISVVGAANSDQLLLSNGSHVSVSHDTRGETREKDAEFDPKFQSHCVENRNKKSHVCTTCGKDFRWSFQLTRHMRTHSDEKLFFCKTCGKHFRRSSYVKRHMIIHSDEKPFFCKTCGRGFRSSGHLTHHMRTHSDEKPYFCQTCGKDFRWCGDLTRHMRTHSDEKPFFCKTCGKHFKRSSHVTRHMIIHSDEKPFFCKTCGKHFRWSNQLTRHMRTHTHESQQF